MSDSSLYARLAAVAEDRDGHVAVRSAAGDEITYRELFARAERTRAGIRSARIEPGAAIVVALADRVAFVPALLGVLAENVAVPMPTSSTARELTDLVTALTPAAALSDPGAAVLGSAGRQLADGCCATHVARLEAAHRDASVDDRVLLSTSGTTGPAPKAIPLSDAMLLAGASAVVETLELMPDDVCLNMMPLTHSLGLVTGVLVPLLSGGSIVMMDGFQPREFVPCVQAAGVTWYSCVPTVHAAVAEAVGGVRFSTLRFVRSSAAPLHPAVRRKVESALRVPVIEAYVMTEAPGQITSGDATGATPGLVGRPSPCEVRIVDEQGRSVAGTSAGEIEIRGPNVIERYLSGGTPSDFSPDGWLRTGDVGVLEEAGELRLTGRMKEVVNSGGEKIAPAEVEAVLLEHEAVGDAVAFGYPHATLGEQVGAAVVLANGESADPRDLQRHVARTLSRLKVPRCLLLVDELPRGRTGKPDREALRRLAAG